MKPSLPLTILLLVAIFALGAWTGHLATLRWGSHTSDTLDLDTVLADVEQDTSKVLPDSATERRLIIRSTRKVMQRYRDTMGLTTGQMDKLKPIFVSVGVEMSELPTKSPLRLGLLQKLHRKIAPLLTDDQRALADQILEQSRASSLASEAGLKSSLTPQTEATASEPQAAQP